MRKGPGANFDEQIFKHDIHSARTVSIQYLRCSNVTFGKVRERVGIAEKLDVATELAMDPRLRIRMLRAGSFLVSSADQSPVVAQVEESIRPSL